MAAVLGNDLELPFSSSGAFKGRIGSYDVFGGSDGHPPVIGGVNPPIGYLITPKVPVAFSVTDDFAIRQLLLVGAYIGSNTRELIWSYDLGFNGFYLGQTNTATPVIVAGVQVGWSFHVLRDGGWPANIQIYAYAVDTSGNALP